MNPIIKPIKKGDTIFSGKKVFTLDSEAFKRKENGIEYQSLANGSMYDGENYLHFTSSTEFLMILHNLSKQYKKIIILIHNMKYDLQLMGLLNRFAENNGILGYESDRFLIGKVNYIKLKKYEKKDVFSIEFLDTTNYIHSKLSKIAKALGLEKFANEEYNKPIEEWNEYIKENGKELCDKDVFILYELYKYMLKIPNFDWSISMASTSFNSYRHYYMPYSIDLFRFNLIGNELYKGGRVELYNKKLHTHCDYLDFNSLYPYVMHKYKYPYKFRKSYYKNTDINYILDNLNNYSYIVRCNFFANDKRTPIMQKTKYGLLCDFQEGNNIFVSGNELKALYDSDSKIEILSFYEFKSDYLFKDFVESNYTYKQNAKEKIFRDLYKLNLNSLYGKFGQSPKILNFLPYENEFKILESFKDTNDRINFNGVNYSLYNKFITYNEKLPYKYSSYLASEITANARLENYYGQKILGFENVLNTDTDSYIIPANMTYKIENLIDDNKLGYLKKEYEDVWFIGYGLKNYKIMTPKENIRKHKGISDNAIKINKKYKQLQWKLLNKTYDNVLLKDVEKEDNNTIEKLKFDKYGNSEIFRNQDEFIAYNKLDKEIKVLNR